MEREPDSLVEQHLDELYDKALKQGAIPWNDAWREDWDSPEDAVYDLEETFPDEP